MFELIFSLLRAISKLHTSGAPVSFLIKYQHITIALLTLLSLGTTLSASERAAHAQPSICEQPNVLFVLDYSGSMNQNNK